MQDLFLKKVEKILDEKVRPQLLKHQGGVQIVDFDQGILKVRLLGKCSNCPSANLTTEQLIEKEITEELPDVKQVILVTGVSDELIDMARSILNKRKEK
jgi:Fe-S cluster biogenesis protein NfuA